MCIRDSSHTVQTLEKLCFKVLEHPAFLLTALILPQDLQIFRDQELKEAVDMWVAAKPTKIFSGGIRKLVETMNQLYWKARGLHWKMSCHICTIVTLNYKKIFVDTYWLTLVYRNALQIHNKMTIADHPYCNNQILMCSVKVYACVCSPHTSGRYLYVALTMSVAILRITSTHEWKPYLFFSVCS